MRMESFDEQGGGWGRDCMRGHGRRGGGHGRHGGQHGHFGGGDGHGRFGGGRGGGGRFFEHGELRHVVLALLGEQPRHGYDIIRAIEQRTGGAYSPSPGVIYPTLQLLEDVGHARQAKSEDERNSYDVTAEGRAFLAEHAGRIADIMARMDQVGRRHKSGAPAIMAAMDELKSALRSGAETWTDADLGEIAEAIQSTANRIRKLRDGARKGPKP